MTDRNKLVEKWNAVLDLENMPAISDSHRRATVAQLLENQTIATARQRAEEAGLFEDAGLETSSPTNNTDGGMGSAASGRIKGYDPVLISLIRRTMPNLMAYNVAGVQPMSGPTGMIFSMRPQYVEVDAGGVRTYGNDAFYLADFPNPSSGSGATAGDFPLAFVEGDELASTPTVDSVNGSNPYTTNTGMTTTAGELLGSKSGDPWQEMGFSIDKITVTAKTRALKAEYSVELAQDLKAIHGLEAESELANILATEILFEINREVIRTIYTVAKVGASNTSVPGSFDLNLDSNGRWAVEKFKGLLFQIEREANIIAKETRRGKGNFIICSSDVASALALAGVLDTGLAMNGARQLEVDDTGNTYAGRLNGKYDVYIDPYAPVGVDYVVVGYKGANVYDAGLFYCPYVPLQMYKTVGGDNFQPRIGFKTRYGMIANPFANGGSSGDPDAGVLKRNANVYYRKFLVRNLSGAAV